MSKGCKVKPDVADKLTVLVWVAAYDLSRDLYADWPTARDNYVTRVSEVTLETGQI